MKKIIVLAAALSLFPVPQAQANLKKVPVFACATVQEIDKEAEDCEGNVLFAEAAVLCLNKLKDLVEAQTSAAKKHMEASTQAYTNDAANSQTNSMGGSAANYGISMDTINRLLLSAKQANAQVGDYVKNVYVPDEFGLVEAGIEKDEILLNEKCYADNKETLLWVEQDIDQIIDELEAMKKMSASLGKSSTVRRSGQDSLSAPAVKSSPKAKGSVGNPKGPARGQSDISGTEKKTEKLQPTNR
jgi:hypothetical protein